MRQLRMKMSREQYFSILQHHQSVSQVLYLREKESVTSVHRIYIAKFHFVSLHLTHKSKQKQKLVESFHKVLKY